ncbi:MAG: alpha/beta hydrolase family protein [Erysipelotrichaceae bacterium]|nr:alpha/beta hydrolase family protein [Erysipelotrichaceae bacterium]
MALIDVKLFSTTLFTNTDIRVVLPTPDEPFKPDAKPYYKGKKYQVLYLLHGMHGDCTVWTRNTGIERYAQEKSLCVVSASVTNSCYLDMVHGGKFMTYMLDELPKFINSTFPVSTRREDTFIAGLSMGGYGTFRLMGEKPEMFGAAASLSGGLDLTAREETGTFKGGPSSRMPMEDIIGDRQIKGSDDDLFTLLPRLHKEGRLPKLYQCCGTEDFLYEVNTRFRDAMLAEGIDLTYEESPGIHNWDYWDPAIRRVLEWLPLAGTLVD